MSITTVTAGVASTLGTVTGIERVHYTGGVGAVGLPGALGSVPCIVVTPRASAGPSGVAQHPGGGLRHRYHLDAYIYVSNAADMPARANESLPYLERVLEALNEAVNVGVGTDAYVRLDTWRWHPRIEYGSEDYAGWACQLLVDEGSTAAYATT